jgi:GcrA cell cycle regulator
MSLNQPTSFQSTWTTERVELLKLRFAEGLSCREIAADIGVSRNAVIGKISRLNLTRDKGRTQTLRQKDTGPRSRASARLRQLLIKIVPSEPEPEPFIEAEPIHNGHTCSLFELSKETCRWPISTPGAVISCARRNSIPSPEERHSRVSKDEATGRHRGLMVRDATQGRGSSP